MAEMTPKDKYILLLEKKVKEQESIIIQTKDAFDKDRNNLQRDMLAVYQEILVFLDPSVTIVTVRGGVADIEHGIDNNVRILDYDNNN